MLSFESVLSVASRRIFEAHVLMVRPVSWVEATKKDKEAQQVVSSQNCKPSFIPRPKPVNPTTPSAPLKIQKLTRAEMDERQLKALCYNCDDKYFPGHKCKERNIFMAISEDISEEDVETPLVPESPEITYITPPFDPPKVEPIISLNALTGFSAPQTLKLIGYIKHRKVIILVDSGSTHNFIHRCISQETHYYIHAVNNFQIMIANGGSMKCGGRCENVRLQIGDYHLKYHMFTIDMGGCDIVLGADWLRTQPCNSTKKATNINSKASLLVHLRSLVPIAWKSYSKKVILVSLPKSMPYKQQRHPRCCKPSKPSFLNIKWYFPLPKNSPLPTVFMIIPFSFYPKAFLPISFCIATPFYKKMKLRKWSRNSLLQTLSVLVRALTLIWSSWS
jgi:hypothetical protein